MNSTWGKKIRLSLFGESHGPAIGIVIDGLPPGLRLDFGKINKQMARRAPGKSKYATPRAEADRYEIISGLYDGTTTGAPLCCVIANTNTRSKDYENIARAMRPGHSDYPAFVKYKGFNDIRGGGHFSGRLTAPIVFAGSICRQLLEKKNIHIYAHIAQIGDVKDRPFQQLGGTDYTALEDKSFCVIDDAQGEKMMERIEQARQSQDSVGGCVEGLIDSLPAGLGNPVFESVESVLAGLLFSIPAVKGVSFGDGFAAAGQRGSASNDAFYYEQGAVKTKTNHCGGILGGITNGMPVHFHTAFKPTPTISQPQQTVDVRTGQNVELCAQGRHDPCVVVRAVAVVEAVAAIAATELLLEAGEPIYGLGTDA